MIDDVKHLHPELKVKALGNSLDRDVLEDGEIQAGDARADDTISARVTS
jgi:hypothetical protein